MVFIKKEASFTNKLVSTSFLKTVLVLILLHIGGRITPDEKHADILLNIIKTDHKPYSVYTVLK